MASSGDLRSLLGAAQFNTLSRDMQAVLQQIWQSHTEGLKADLEKNRVDGEQKILQLQKKSQDLEAKLAVFTAENEKGESALCQYREQAASSSSVAARLTEENSKLASERDTLKRQIFNAKAERDDMLGLADRRMTELERLHAKIRELNEEINSATAAKCEAQGKTEDLEKRESALEFKEKRFSDEKEFLESQIKNLQGEVDRLSEEVLAAKREAGLRSMQLNQELAERCEEVKAARRQEELLLEDIETFRTRSEQLAEKLREARESENKLEENYRAELKAQTKLAELYKQHGEENVNKTQDLANAITELQGLLKESGEKYGRLETELANTKSSHAQQMDAKNEAIKLLKKELEEANKFLKTVKDKGLTEDGIECLSPSAAQASRLLKSGVTLTGIYSQMVNLSEELAMEKEENKKLNGYMDQILLEIEERAPILKQQREDYEQAMAAVGGLTESLEAAREEVELRRSEADDARRKLNTLERDRDRLDRMVADMGKQVAVLVREVDAARAGGLISDAPPAVLDTSSAEAVIAGKLLTFRDVTELQQKNIELLTVVRELTANRDQNEASLVEEKTAEVRQELDSALRQVEELRSARERQQLMVENIIQQRDLYKSMCGAQKEAVTATVSTPGSTPRKSSDATTGQDKQREQLEKQLEELKEEFNEYKKDKCENYSMLEKEMNKMRDDLFEARSHSAKLSSNEEYNSERFKISQNNCNSYKKQIEALELRNKQLDVIAAKHENSVTSLREELMASIKKQSQAEFQVDQLSQKIVHLKASEARLIAEREVFHREKLSSSKIMANLQQIQLNLERSDEESKTRLQNENTNLTKEVELLRQKLDQEQEHFKSSVRNWESTNKELREKADNSNASEKAALEQMNAMATTLETMKDELRNKEEELQLAESRLAGRGQLNSSFSGDSDGKNRLRDVELLLAQTKQELKSVNKQLIEQKKRAQEFKMISETAETRMLESSKAMTDYKEETDGKLKAYEEGKLAMEKKAGQVQAEMTTMKEKIQTLECEAGASGGELTEKLRVTAVNLDDARERIAHLEQQNNELTTQITALSEESRETQEKYERELLLHAKDIEKLNAIKADHTRKDSHMEEIELEKKRAEEKLAEVRQSLFREAEARVDEIKALTEQLEIAEKENSALLSQLEKVSSQLADVSATGRSADASSLDVSTLSNTSFLNRSLNEDDASNEQLLSIIKYLRREKDIIGSRLEVLQTEMIRVSSQLELSQKSAQDAQQALELEREGHNQSALSASKHAELIRKVESLSALTDSNRMLREEKEKLDNIVDSYRKEADKAKELVGPLEEKVKNLQDKVSTLTVEKTALDSEVQTWKKRSDQLVEKSIKLNPEELRRLQDQNTKLNKVVASLNSEKSQQNEKISSQAEELRKTKMALTATQVEAKKEKLELNKLQTESKTQLIQAKNIQQNLSKQNADLRKEIEKAKTESAMNVNKLKKEATDLTAKLDQLSKGGGEEMSSLKQELEKLKTEYANSKEKATAQEASSKTTINSLKSLGRKFREANAKLEAEVKELKTEKETWEKKATEFCADGKITLEEANKLLEELTPAHENLTKEHEALKAELEELRQSYVSKEQRAKEVLRGAKTKIDKVAEENAELISKIEQLEKGGSTMDSSEVDAMKSAYNSQINKMKDDKVKLDADNAELLQEKERLQAQVEHLQQELAAAATLTTQATPKPVAVAGVVQDKQQQARKQAQPQAHIPPHRHQPRDEHRPPTQTASIRPMTQQRAAANQAVVLPTSQVTAGQPAGQSTLPEVATVQPTVSVSPSVSSSSGSSVANPVQPSTSQAASSILDPAAPEFVPMLTEATAGEEEPPFAVVNPRHDQPQASTSGPTAPVHTAQTSTTSGGNPTTASVPPNLKRTRDSSVEVDTVDDRPGPSGIQKRPRTISSTEYTDPFNLTEEGVSSGSTQAVDGGVTEEEHSQQGPSSGVGLPADASTEEEEEEGEEAAVLIEAVETDRVDDMEEGEINEEGEEEVEVEVGDTQDLDAALADDDEAGMDPDLEVDIEAEPELDVVGVGDEVDGQQVLEEVDIDEELREDRPSQDDGTGEDSSEPSSSSGPLRRAGEDEDPTEEQKPEQEQVVVSGNQPTASGFEQDLSEDGVVPGTPKLIQQPKRTDGFAEVLSNYENPDQALQSRFVFGPGPSGLTSGGGEGPSSSSCISGNSGLMGQAGVERTSVDIGQFTTEPEEPSPAGDTAGDEPTDPSGEENPEEESSTENRETEASSRESEEGVSSSGRGGGEHQSRIVRTPIVWGSSAASSSSPQPPASTSPQRTIVRTRGAPQIVRSALEGLRGRPARGTAARGTAARGTAARGTAARGAAARGAAARGTGRGTVGKRGGK